MENMIAIAFGCFIFLLLTGCFRRKKRWGMKEQLQWLEDHRERERMRK